MEPVVRAVDVGRGNTKYIANIRNGEPVCAMFPSQAPPARQHMKSIAGEPGTRQYPYR